MSLNNTLRCWHVFHYVWVFCTTLCSVVQVAHDADVTLTTNMAIGMGLHVTNVCQGSCYPRALNVPLVRLYTFPLLFGWSSDSSRLLIRDEWSAIQYNIVIFFWPPWCFLKTYYPCHGQSVFINTSSLANLHPLSLIWSNHKHIFIPKNATPVIYESGLLLLHPIQTPELVRGMLSVGCSNMRRSITVKN